MFAGVQDRRLGLRNSLKGLHACLDASLFTNEPLKPTQIYVPISAAHLAEMCAQSPCSTPGRYSQEHTNIEKSALGPSQHALLAVCVAKYITELLTTPQLV